MKIKLTMRVLSFIALFVITEITSVASLVTPRSDPSSFASLRQSTRKYNLAFLPPQHGTTNSYRSATGTQSRVTKRLFSASPLLAKDGDYDETCDVLVIGSGPAARAIASLLSSPTGGKLDVVLADKNLDREWPPNYGVWKDEWQAIIDRYQAVGVQLEGGKCGDSIDHEWNVTDCFFGGSFDIPTDQSTRLDRPYYRVDKHALQKSLSPSSYRMLKANHISKAVGVNLYEPAGSLVHDATGTTIQLKTGTDDILTVRSKLVVDCTGHETKLVLRDTRDPYRPPGFQIAYGALVEIDESNSPDLSRVGPYAKEAMTLFDYRTDHFNSVDSALISKVESSPTFMYAMPLGGNRIFFEETSLVARPAVSFQECKDRCFERLKYHGIQVTKIEEEEFCYIPMGGALPAKDQRILALGGAAAMVHPSTGYHVCRCMIGAADLATAVLKELAVEEPNLDVAAASGYHSLWSPENIRQRNFAVFGGEFLMQQNVVGLRGFFDGFFRLPLGLWGGFLAGWPGLPNNENHESWYARIWYGMNFLVRIPPPVAVDMVGSIVAYMIAEGVPLPQSVTPFLGEPASYELKPNTNGVGDVAAKMEARRMIEASALGQDLPSDFSAGGKQSAPEKGTSVSELTPVEVSEESTAGIESFSELS
jgi:lycopene beta-cyclase